VHFVFGHDPAETVGQQQKIFRLVGSQQDQAGAIVLQPSERRAPNRDVVGLAILGLDRA
jgi:hypothetical protein